MQRKDTHLLTWLRRIVGIRPDCIASQPHATEPLASSTEATVEQQESAEALVDAISRWPEWVTRRVDSLHLLERSRGRRQHSIDCIPPPDPRLAYDPAEQEATDINLVRGQIMVPLAYLKKTPLRHLNVAQADGSPMPVLGSDESCALMVSALVRVLEKSGVQKSEILTNAMQDLVLSSGESNLARVEGLFASGCWNGTQLWSADLKLDSETQDFLVSLATNFVLIGLIPAAGAGLRQVLKLSYHWTLNWSSTALENTKTAFRMTGSEIEIPLHMPAATKSYHLEFQVPPELGIRELSLPSEGERSSPVSSALDTSWSPVAHVHSSFDLPPTKDAIAVLIVPRRGPWTSALIVSMLTSIVFLLALYLPGASRTLMQLGGNAAALLLAAPAVFIGFLAMQREHAFASRLLDPLRAIVMGCAILLFAMAGSVVGGLIDPWRLLLWHTSAALSAAVCVALLLGDRMDKMPRDSD